MMPLGLETTEHDDWALVSARGEIDVATAPQLRERVIDLVADGHRFIVIDLDQVDFLDSTGLGVLVGALKRVKTHEGELHLVCSQPRILRVFEITGLLQVLPIHESIDAALQRPE